MKRLYCVKCLIDMETFNDPNGFLRCIECGGKTSNVSYLSFREKSDSINIQREITNLVVDLMININSFISENATKFVLMKATKSYVANIEKHLWSLKTCNNSACDREGKFATAREYYGDIAVGQYNDHTLEQIDTIMTLHRVLGTANPTKTDSIIKPFYYPSYSEINNIMNRYLKATYPDGVLPKRVVRGLVG